MKNPKPSRVPVQPFHNPFAALKDRLPDLPPGKATPEPPEKKPAPRLRAVVRLEKKGRRGKQVTCVEKLAVSSTELEQWLEDLKKSLGCGGVVEGPTLVLQGDQRDRVKVLLENRGVVVAG